MLGMATAVKVFTLVGHFSAASGLLTGECNSDQWQCSLSGNCINSGWICDGWIDCEDDKSDSWASNCNDCQDMAGGVDAFIKCKSPLSEVEMCLNKTFFGCNGRRDCMDWSDEKDCGDCEQLGEELGVELFRCHSDGTCTSQHCQGDWVTNCQDFSDEMVSSCPDTTLGPRLGSCGLKGMIVGQNSVALLAELGSLMGMFVIGYWVLGNFTFIRSGTFNSHICDWEMGETSMLTFK